MQSTTSFNEFKDRVRRNYSTNDEEYSDWMLSVKATLGILRKRSWQMSIYKVPDNLRRLKEDAYIPHIVSIGPFHQGKHELRAMEEHKWLYMLDFLRRASAEKANQEQVAGSEETALNKCGEVILNLEEEARACYAESINLDKHQLVEVLLVDGCFILELFIKHAEEIMSKHKTEHQLDPIINNSWMVLTLQRDLALLENQIPFAVLHKLFKIVVQNSALPFSLNKYVLLFFRSALNLSDKAVEGISNSLTGKHKHLLDMLHHIYKPTIYPKGNLKGPELAWEFRRCATQLFKSGVQFQVGDQGSSSLMDITFIDGVMTIPPLFIDKATGSIFRNLIAFEQCNFASTHHMSSYAILVSSLIRSPKDAQLLGPEIFDIEGGEDVSIFLNSLRKEVVFRDVYFTGLCEEVNKYHRFPLQWGRVKAYFKVLSDEWSESLEDLKQNYFRSRWSFISFLAASLVIFLTVLQTVYSVLSYYPPLY